MKKASEIMFKIGNIFTIIYLALGVILFVAGLIGSIGAGVALAAAGGDEGNIFAGDLYRMYTKYAERKVGKLKNLKAKKVQPVDML